MIINIRNNYKPDSILKEEMEIYPLTDVQTLMKLEPTMKTLIEDSITKYKTIACKIPFFNEQNLVLKDKQEKMVSFHKEYMKKINHDEIKTRLNKIFNEIDSTVKLINWDVLAKVDMKYFLLLSGGNEKTVPALLPKRSGKRHQGNYSLPWKVGRIKFDYIKVQSLRLISKGVLIATPEKLSAKFAFKIVKGDSRDFQGRL